MGFKSAVAKASTKSSSVRTTIPEEVAKALQVTPGDVLDWDLMPQKGRAVAKVRKLE